MSDSTTEAPQTNGSSEHGKVPTSVQRVYDIPVVKESIGYADNLLRSYSLSNAAYSTAESIATTVYKKAGEPLQDKLQPRIDQLDGIANQGLDYIQNKAPYIFDAKTDELVSNARKPADQAYSTAKSYQQLVSTRLHDTLTSSRDSLGGIQNKLAAAAAHVPKTSEELNQVTHHLYEQLEALRSAIVKQSGDLPNHISSALQPYLEKLQKGASDVKIELGKKDVPIHLKAQHIIGITKDVTTDSLHDAIETVKLYVNKTNSEITANGEEALDGVKDMKINDDKTVGDAAEEVKKNGEKAAETVKDTAAEKTEQTKESAKDAKKKGEQATEKAKDTATEKTEQAKKSAKDAKKDGEKAAEKTKQTTSEKTEEAKKGGKGVKSNAEEIAESEGKKASEVKKGEEHPVESTEQFIEEHAPGDHSYAAAVKTD